MFIVSNARYFRRPKMYRTDLFLFIFVVSNKQYNFVQGIDVLEKSSGTRTNDYSITGHLP